MTETTFCGKCVDGRELMWGLEGMEWKLNEMVGMEMESVGTGGDGYNFCPCAHLCYTFLHLKAGTYAAHRYQQNHSTSGLSPYAYYEWLLTN